jgi:hypothetical protein
MRGRVFGVVANVLPRPVDVARARRDVVDRSQYLKVPAYTRRIAAEKDRLVVH